MTASLTLVDSAGLTSGRSVIAAFCSLRPGMDTARHIARSCRGQGRALPERQDVRHAAWPVGSCELRQPRTEAEGKASTRATSAPARSHKESLTGALRDGQYGTWPKTEGRWMPETGWPGRVSTGTMSE